MTIETDQSKSVMLVIIPTYNERANLPEVISKVINQPVDLEILVVDDNSPDGTGVFVAELSKNDPRIHLMSRPEKLGLGTAYVAGFKFALERNFKYIVEMDADLSHDPNEIPNLLKAIKEVDLVIGSRYVRGVNVVNWPLRRLMLSYFASMYTRFLTRIPIRDTTSGFKCFRREVLQHIELDSIRSGGYAFQVEVNWLVWKSGFRIREIPIIFVDRTVGQSKMSKKIVREAIMMVGRLFIKGILHRVPSTNHR